MQGALIANIGHLLQVKCTPIVLSINKYAIIVSLSYHTSKVTSITFKGIQLLFLFCFPVFIVFFSPGFVCLFSSLVLY